MHANFKFISTIFTITFLLLIFGSKVAKAQTVETWQWEDLDEVIKANNDTLYIINFWATWCKPCVEELPYFEEVTEKYEGKNVKVILVSLDFSKQVETKLIPFVAQNNLSSRVVYFNEPNYNSWINKVSDEWSGSIPATLFVQNDYFEFCEQDFDFEELQEKIDNNLNIKK